MSRNGAEKVSVSLYELDQALVEHVQAERHYTSFSGALRFILRDWAQGKGLKLEDVLRRPVAPMEVS